MADHFSEETISYVFEIFRQYDTSKTGMVSLQDIPAAMLALGFNPTREELETLIQTVVKENHEYVDFPEFLTILALKVKDAEPEEELRQAFRVFDVDGNGRVNASELKNTMFSLGEHMNKEEVNFMIQTADVTGDGQVNYEEFIRMMFTGLS